jgi:hypothetical protein
LKLLTSTGTVLTIDWNVNILLNYLKVPAGILLVQKKSKL